ncbi:MAG: hypothetical protein WD771_11550 [Gemmatimonadaceae bacterium]
MSGARVVLGIALALTAAGCATTQGPKRWLATGAETQTTAFGGWAELRLVSGDSVKGELIAVSHDVLWIMRDSAVAIYIKGDVQGGRVIGWNSAASDVITIAFFGVVSTLTHGALLIISAPIWMFVGGMASNSQAELPVRHLTVTDWSQLGAWARFPQGLPDGLDLATLRPKPR